MQISASLLALDPFLLLSMALFDWIRPRPEGVPNDADAAFVRGDRDRLESIYRQTFTQVRRAVAGVLREPADRDAIVQQVYLELIAERRLRESYRGGSMAAWLSAIARHRALDYARRQRRLTPLGEHEEPTEPTLADELRRELLRFAARLDPSRRTLLELRFVQGLTQVEAAKVLSIPRSTLESREHELKALLRAYLRSDSVETGEEP
jgi:RNA polymerase sigma-70 factor (ECF subfamily)